MPPKRSSQPAVPSEKAPKDACKPGWIGSSASIGAVRHDGQRQISPRSVVLDISIALAHQAARVDLVEELFHIKIAKPDDAALTSYETPLYAFMPPPAEVARAALTAVASRNQGATAGTDRRRRPRVSGEKLERQTRRWDEHTSRVEMVYRQGTRMPGGQELDGRLSGGTLPPTSPPFGAVEMGTTAPTACCCPASAPLGERMWTFGPADSMVVSATRQALVRRCLRSRAC
jgi:hypothetical protein